MNKKSSKIRILDNQAARPRREQAPPLRRYTPDDRLDRTVELLSVALHAWERRTRNFPDGL